MSYPRRNPPPQGPGIAPLEDGLVLPALRQHLSARRNAEGDRPTADATRLRASWAMDCGRKIAFQVLGVPPDYELDGDTLAAFEVGQSYHTVIQEAGVDQLGWEVEVVASYKPDLSLSCHLDFVETLPDGRKAAGELKSVASYGIGVAVGDNPRKPYGESRPGPEPRHLVQAGLGAMAPNIGAEWVHYIAVNKDKAGVHEWLIHLDEPLWHLDGVTLRELVTEELERLAGLLVTVDRGNLPARWVPEFGLVDDPPGYKVSRGDPWVCRFCSWNATCRGLPTEAIPIPVSLREGPAA